jgi:hypothetical protein
LLRELCRNLRKKSFIKYWIWMTHVQLLTLRRQTPGAYTTSKTTVCTADHTAANVCEAIKREARGRKRSSPACRDRSWPISPGLPCRAPARSASRRSDIFCREETGLPGLGDGVPANQRPLLSRITVLSFCLATCSSASSRRHQATWSLRHGWRCGGCWT